MGMSNYDDSYDYGDYGADGDASYDGALVDPNMSGADGNKGESDFDLFMKSNSCRIENGKWRCSLCGKVTSHIGNNRQHFETHHYVALQYKCDICGRECRTRNALACHKVKCRRAAIKRSLSPDSIIIPTS